MAYEINWEERGYCCRMHGSVSVAEVVKSIEDETTDPRYSSADFRITDLLAITDHTVTLSDAVGLATIDSARKKMNPNLLDAIVVSDPFVTKIAQLYKATSDRSELIGIFKSVEEARSWLDKLLLAR